MNKCDLEETRNVLIQKFLNEYWETKVRPTYYFGKLDFGKYEISIHGCLYYTTLFHKHFLCSETDDVKQVHKYWKKVFDQERDDAECQRLLKSINKPWWKFW